MSLSMLEFFVPAFLLGLLGSVHCVGMCGPIAMALPVHQFDAQGKALRYVLYHIGKILSYTLLGAVVGSFGAGFLLLGVQQWLSIGIGVLMILFVLFSGNYFGSFSIGIFSKLNGWIKTKFSAFIQQKTLSSFWFIGLLNGLLPCGLVYAGLAGALATFSVAGAVGFMFFFGLGTVPLLMLFTIYANAAGFKTMRAFQKAVPVVLIAMGVLLILRGLNMGIPFISPQLAIPESGAATCN
jgi:sulfite exporter TauE/SafE